MAICVSLLGDQPAAFATAYKALADTLDLCRVVLLPTRLSAQHASRLEAWLRREYPRTACEIVPVSDEAASDDPLPLAHDVVCGLVGQVDEIVFFADAGLNFQVARVARSLGGDATLVHGDSETVLVRRYRSGRLVQETRHVSANLGLAQLLELHGLNCRNSNRMPDLLRDYLNEHGISVPEGMQIGLEIEVPSGDLVKLDLAYERHGLLVGLASVGTKRNCQRMLELQQMPKGKKRDHGFQRLNKALLQKARSLDALQRLVRPRPRLAVFSFSNTILDHARKSRHLDILRTSHRRGATLLRQWVNGRVIAPDWNVPVSPATVPLRTRYRGMGGDGPPLVVWAGSDPSATLASIHAHRPEIVYLVYDQTTADVVSVAQRICEVAFCLPVGTLIPIASDNLGCNIQDRLEEIQRGHALVRADVSPGTKAQACVSARLLSTELWSLDNARHVARCLERPEQTLQLQPTPLRTQAIVVGGPLSKKKRPQPVEDASRPFYRAVGQFLDALVCERRQRGPRLESICFDTTTHWECSRGSLSITKQLVRVELDGRKSKGRFRQRDGGRWFEPLVANALLDAGADEVLTNLTWERESSPERHFIELDVAARFGRQYYAVSCKKSSEALAHHRKEIVTVAGQTLGRFAIPVLAVPWANPEVQARPGAMLLDLSVLTDPVKLREVLDRAWSDRSTRRWEQPQSKNGVCS